MDQRLSDQLDKVIALADSSHDGEAAAAVRKARQLLSKGGLSFGDLAQAAISNRDRWPIAPAMSGRQIHLETQILQLRQKADELQSALQIKELQLEFWRRRAMELEQSLNHKQTEAERWRSLASDTVDKLWDLGKSLKDEEHADSAAVPDPLFKTATSS